MQRESAHVPAPIARSSELQGCNHTGIRREGESFGGAVYFHRLRLGLPQAAVAAGAGMSAGYFSELENSKRPPPPLRTVIRLASALRLDAIETQKLADLASAARSEVENDAHLPANVRNLVSTIRSVAPRLQADLVDALHAKIREACM